jgi:phosphoenolpyruvate carboxykinase (GTP)
MKAPAPAHADQSNAPGWVSHQGLRRWVTEMARLAKPERIVWCDGSQSEYDR